MRLTADKLARLALLWSEAVGPAGLLRLVVHFDTAERVLAASPDDLASPDLGLRPEQISLIAGLLDRMDSFEAEWDECRRRYIRVLFPEDEGYPRIVCDLPNRPGVLSLRGNWLAADDPAVGIVGTRRPTQPGLRMAEVLARTCAAEGLTVVSGLAFGIDQAAHQAALDADGRTIAAIGCGILALERDRTGGLEARLAESGAVLSEFAPRAVVTVPHLMARNRLTSGLSRALIVVQSRHRGGALITARNAARQGRIVAAVPWPDDVPEGEGCRNLLQEGAIELRGADDMRALAERLREEQPPPPSPSQLPLLGE
jgi:DNA processing protein